MPDFELVLPLAAGIYGAAILGIGLYKCILSRSSLSAHTAIIELASSLTIIQDPEGGLCQGISVGWMNACAINQEVQFNARVQRIIKENKTIVQQLKVVKSKVEQRAELNPSEQELLDIMAFYDNVALQQSSRQFSEVFDKDFSQDDLIDILPFTQSKELEDAGGLHAIYTQANTYTVPEMTQYFTDLSARIDAVHPPLKEPLVFILASLTSRDRRHAISLSYDAINKKWTFMDINQWPPKPHVSPAELTRLVSQSFTFKSPRNEGIAFKITGFSTGRQKSIELTELMVSFKESHVPAFADPTHLDVAYLCYIMENDSKTTKYLASRPDAGLIFNDQMLVNLAASYGHASVIAAIAALPDGKGIKLLSTRSPKGWSPLDFAVDRGHASVITVIAALPDGKGIELLSARTPEGLSLADLAALHGHGSVITAIAELPDGKGIELLSARMPDGWTPACLAAFHGHASVITAIAELPDGKGIELLNARMLCGWSPADVAASYGHASVMEVLAKLPQGIMLLRDIDVDTLSAIASLDVKKCAAIILLDKIALVIGNDVERTQQLEQISKELDPLKMDEKITQLKRQLLDIIEQKYVELSKKFKVDKETMGSLVESQTDNTEFSASKVKKA